jgi:hypothetical protein
LDLEKLLNLKAFEAIPMNDTDRSVNPVFVSTVDGGPDKDPRWHHQFIQHHLELTLSQQMLLAEAHLTGLNERWRG